MEFVEVYNVSLTDEIRKLTDSIETLKQQLDKPNQSNIIVALGMAIESMEIRLRKLQFEKMQRLRNSRVTL